MLADGKTISGEVKATIGTAPFMLYRTGEATMLARVKNPTVSGALEGTWTGSLDVGGNQIGLILTIANRPDGTASVLIAQAGEPEVQVDAALKENGTAVSFEVPATQGAWSGTLSGDTHDRHLVAIGGIAAADVHAHQIEKADVNRGHAPA